MQRLLIPVFWWTPFLMAGWTMNSFGTWANPDGTIYPESKPGVVRNIFVGKLSCAARLNDLTHIQTWCYKGSSVVWNQVISLEQSAVMASDYKDHKPNEPTATITWLVAYIEGNPKTVAYQVAFSPDSEANLPATQLSGTF